jgi:hypothetical protein
VAGCGIRFAAGLQMLPGSPTHGRRDLRIDWLRGLAMTCVIINHSRMSSLLSWFSYERFWVVTAAEVFVVLSGLVLGTVYRNKLNRGGWSVVIRGLGRRAVMLYFAFVAVTLSVLLMSWIGVDVSSLTNGENGAATWFRDAQAFSLTTWRDVALMVHGPWAFEIVAMYVWLLTLAVPAMLALNVGGWRPVLAVSWALYAWYRIAPHPLTMAGFESVFPLLAWQLPFIHGLVIGYHRERVGAFAARCPKAVPAVAAGIFAAFMTFAWCNPWNSGSAWLHIHLVSPEHFTSLYERFFSLTSLGLGRLVNLAVGLPLGYAVLTWGWRWARQLGIVFVTLGQQSLGAFVLHVYGILLLAHLPHTDEFWTNTLVQLMLVAAIAALLHSMQHVRVSRRTVTSPAPVRTLAASFPLGISADSNLSHRKSGVAPRRRVA